MDIRTLLFVAIGGMAGAASRWALLEVWPDNSSWPWQIFIINMAGSCILGMHSLKTFPEAFTSFNLGASDRVMWFLYNLFCVFLRSS